MIIPWNLSMALSPGRWVTVTPSGEICTHWQDMPWSHTRNKPNKAIDPMAKALSQEMILWVFLQDLTQMRVTDLSLELVHWLIIWYVSQGVISILCHKDQSLWFIQRIDRNPCFIFCHISSYISRTLRTRLARITSVLHSVSVNSFIPEFNFLTYSVLSRGSSIISFIPSCPAHRSQYSSSSIHMENAMSDPTWTIKPWWNIVLDHELNETRVLI